MDNHTYNLIKAVSKKAQTLWRYEQYVKDAGDCKKCKELWEKLKRQDEAHLEEMKEVLSEHIIAEKL